MKCLKSALLLFGGPGCTRGLPRNFSFRFSSPHISIVIFTFRFFDYSAALLSLFCYLFLLLPNPPKKKCERSVPPITLLKNLRALRSSHHPPKKIASVPSLPSTSYKICGRSVPLITLQKSLRALRSSHHPPTKFASVPFLPSPS